MSKLKNSIILGDGKDVCDVGGANAKAKAEREVNAGTWNTDTPSEFTQALICGEGLVNSVCNTYWPYENISHTHIIKV